MPFHAQEVSHPGGAYYGQNAISNNMIFVNRHSLLNGNSIVLGVPGGGKSFMVKENIVSIFLSNPDADIVIIDPEREYNALVKAFGGEVINISANSPNHINAMDMNANYEDEGNPVTLNPNSLCPFANSCSVHLPTLKTSLSLTDAVRMFMTDISKTISAHSNPLSKILEKNC